MDDKERLDAEHAETLIFRKEKGEFDEKLTENETQNFLAEMESKLADVIL